VNLGFPFPVGIIPSFMLEENLSGSVARVFYVLDALLSPVQQCQSTGVNSLKAPTQTRKHYHWPYAFLIHSQTREVRVVAAFVQALQLQSL